MQEDKFTICNECGSEFLKECSKMLALCPECAHILYGYPNCDHVFKNGICIHCRWNGSRSDYIKRLISNKYNPAMGKIVPE